jgi:hypothetical protein
VRTPTVVPGWAPSLSWSRACISTSASVCKVRSAACKGEVVRAYRFQCTGQEGQHA